jgi:hypothetical protein
MAVRTAGSSHGPGRLSLTPALNIALSTAFLASLGLASLVPINPHSPPNRRVRTRTHGGVGGAGPRGSPIPIAVFQAANVGTRCFATLCPPYIAGDYSRVTCADTASQRPSRRTHTSV